MKRKYASFLAIMCCLSLPIANGIVFSDSVFPLNCYAEEPAEETITQDGLVYTRKTSAVDDYWLITGCEAADTDHQVYIPAEIDGVPVRASGSSFREFHSVESFVVDPENEQLCSVDGVLFSKDMTILYRYPPFRSGAYVIPDGVTNISWAFEDCTKLTRLTIPDSVTEEVQTFGACRQLSEINGSFYMSSGYGFRACNQLKSLHIEVPDVMGIQSFGNLDCYAWENLESIVVGKNCELSGDFLIRQCPVLTTIDFSDAIALTPAYDKASVLIEGCKSLKEISLPPVTDADDWANLEISNCSEVETIKIYGGWWVKITGCPDAVVYGYRKNDYLKSYCETLELSFIPFGDTNADQEISIVDVLALNKNLLAGEPLCNRGKNAADYDGDGMITAADSLCILKSTIGLTE